MSRRDFLKSSAMAATIAYAPSSLQPEAQERGIVRYPGPWVEVTDERFGRMILFNAAVERLYTGARWSEGPVWFGDGRYLVWSDIPNNRVVRWAEETGHVSVFRQPIALCFVGRRTGCSDAQAQGHSAHPIIWGDR